MKKNKLFGIIFSLLITLVFASGFFTGNDSGNSLSIIDYLNNGGNADNVPVQPYHPDVLAAWNAGTNMPAPTRFHGAGALWSNVNADTLKLVCFGGDPDGSSVPTTLVNVYNAATNAWTFGIPLPTGKEYNFACCVGDTVYSFGGLTGSSISSLSSTVDRYNVRTNTLSAGTPIPRRLADGRALGYQDSLIYVLGGWDTTALATANVYLYNIYTGTYRTATSLPQPRASFAAAITGDTIVVICGGSGYNTGLVNFVYKGLINQSDRSQITWSAGTSYPGTGRHRMYAGSWGCKGIIVGPSSMSGFTTNSECYVYSPGNDIWTAQPSVPFPTSAYFSGSGRVGLTGTWKFIVASGIMLSMPYSIPQTQVFTDLLCPILPPPGLQTTVCRNGLNVNVPDNFPAGVTDTMRIPSINGCIVFDVNIKLDTFTHTYDSDMAFRLLHGAQNVLIINRVGGAGDNYIGLNLNDSAAIPLANGTPPFTGLFKPSSPLNAFNTTPTNGPWVLQMLDLAANDLGILKAWCLSITYLVPLGGIQTIEIPNTYRLNQNYPNPFNPATTISYRLPRPGNVKLVVYDILGREVKTLVDEFKTEGMYKVSFDATSFASGVYFYTLKANDFTSTKKMLIVK